MSGERSWASPGHRLGTVTEQPLWRRPPLRYDGRLTECCHEPDPVRLGWRGSRRCRRMDAGGLPKHRRFAIGPGGPHRGGVAPSRRARTRRRPVVRSRSPPVRPPVSGLEPSVRHGELGAHDVRFADPRRHPGKLQLGFLDPRTQVVLPLRQTPRRVPRRFMEFAASPGPAEQCAHAHGHQRLPTDKPGRAGDRQRGLVPAARRSRLGSAH